MVYLQYERIIRFHHEPGKGHYIIYFTLNERAVENFVTLKRFDMGSLRKTCSREHEDHRKIREPTINPQGRIEINEALNNIEM